nr:MAG TPA: hypothetical protein [Bacteriophage sp.]
MVVNLKITKPRSVSSTSGFFFTPYSKFNQLRSNFD